MAAEVDLRSAVRYARDRWMIDARTWTLPPSMWQRRTPRARAEEGSLAHRCGGTPLSVRIRLEAACDKDGEEKRMEPHKTTAASRLAWNRGWKPPACATDAIPKSPPPAVGAS